MSPECFVEKIADGVADEGRGRQKEGEAGVLAHHRHGRFLLFHRDATYCAVSWTNTPILGWLGSKPTRTPLSSSASLVVGPIEATIIFARPSRTLVSTPSSAAM